MEQFDAVVIGAGPGGYVCAIRLAQLGIKTAIIEKENFGGVCLNVGCIPSKALIHAAGMYHKASHDLSKMGISVGSVDLDLTQMQTWKREVVKKLTGGVQNLLKSNGVTALKGTATFKDANTISVDGKDVKSKNFVIATGSRVIEIPPLPFNGKNVISSTEALELTELPEKMVIVGGGFIGLEIGIVYAKLGSKVTIVEALDQVLATVDKDLVRVVLKNMAKFGIQVMTKAKAKGIVESDPASQKTIHLKVETAEGKEERLPANIVLVSVGRKPNSDHLGLDKVGVSMDDRGNIKIDRQAKTSVAGIYAIGDVTGAPQLAHRASMDGLLVASTISGKPAYRDYKCVPWAVFSDPEIAVCGLSEEEAKKQGFSVKIGTFPFVASGRALSTNETEGFIKVIIDETSEAILGVHMVGPEASNLIAEAALAIEMGACVEDVVRTIHTHPTLPEAFPEAIETAFGLAIHIYKPLRKRKA